MEAIYRSADLIMGDAGIRKSMQRVITNYRSEGSVDGQAVYVEGVNPLTRQSVEGSGFAVALKLNEDAGSSPFVLNGFQLEFTAGGRH